MTDAKALVIQFCELFSERRLDEMFALLSDDVEWSSVGKPGRFAYGGIHRKPEATAYLPGFVNAFSSFRFDALDVIAEGPKVAIEASSHAVMPSGKIYANEYLMHFLVHDGLIVKVREFYDQQELLEFVAD